MTKNKIKVSPGLSPSQVLGKLCGNPEKPWPNDGVTWMTSMHLGPPDRSRQRVNDDEEARDFEGELTTEKDQLDWKRL